MKEMKKDEDLKKNKGTVKSAGLSVISISAWAFDLIRPTQIIIQISG